MSDYRSGYDWPANGTLHNLVTAQDLKDGLSQIGGQKFALVTCFDVLEHLEDPATVSPFDTTFIADDGKIFITVPNGRTLFELRSGSIFYSPAPLNAKCARASPTFSEIRRKNGKRY